MNKIIHGDSLEVLKEIESESVDLLCTGPPYGYSFMGKAWDKALPDIAAKQLHRQFIGIEREKEYVEISEARLVQIKYNEKV